MMRWSTAKEMIPLSKPVVRAAVPVPPFTIDLPRLPVFSTLVVLPLSKLLDSPWENWSG
jgi:hypothetical protein